jgi:hypothetical protein
VAWRGLAEHVFSRPWPMLRHYFRHRRDLFFRTETMSHFSPTIADSIGLLGRTVDEMG